MGEKNSHTARVRLFQKKNCNTKNLFPCKKKKKVFFSFFFHITQKNSLERGRVGSTTPLKKKRLVCPSYLSRAYNELLLGI